MRILLTVTLFFLWSCERPHEGQFQQSKSELRVEILDSSGFGYNIYKKEKLLIHQPSIPAVSGNKPFDSKKDAEKVAELVVKKLENNVFPPTISLKELDSLGIK